MANSAQNDIRTRIMQDLQAGTGDDNDDGGDGDAVRLCMPDAAAIGIMGPGPRAPQAPPAL